MNLYKEVIKALSKKTAADFDIEAVKRRIAATRARTPIPVADPPPAQRPVNPYSQYGKVVSSRNIPQAASDNVRHIANKPVAQPAPTAQPVPPAPQRTVPTNRPVVPNTPVTRPPAPVANTSAQVTRQATPTPQPNVPVARPAVPAQKQAVPANKPAAQGQQPTAPQYQLTEDGIKYTQYQLNDPRLKRYRKRLKNMGFARFDENGPWLATPHGASTMRELQMGLDRARIAEMLDEGQVPAGVFGGPSKPIETNNQGTFKTQAQPTVQPNQVTAQAIRSTVQPQQPATPVKSITPAVQQPTPANISINRTVNQAPVPVQQNAEVVNTQNTKTPRTAPSRTEALRQRQEAINKDIFNRYPC